MLRPNWRIDNLISAFLLNLKFLSSIEEAVEADKTFNMLIGDEGAPRKRFIARLAKNTNLDV